MQPNSTTENTGRLCSIYCTHCKKVTTKISFNLLREAGSAEVLCPNCRESTLPRIRWENRQNLVYPMDGHNGAERTIYKT